MGGVADLAELLADLSIWRAGLHILDTEHRPTGPTRHTTIERAHQQQLQRRILDNDANTQLPQTHWAATVARIDPRISTDPTLPVIASHVDAASRAGIDIEHQLTQAAQQQPLPDEMPAAALWARLEIDENAITTNQPDPTRHPDSQTQPEPADPQPTNPDPAGQEIADAIRAADLGHHTEYTDDYSANQNDPYQPEPDTGHDIDW
ncbi:hypothetical protein ACIA8C_05730 [Nocardia sp. NPDC051321]|uniref:hypothetical protein n=1 Tax=Nocardia sp. NPDC051321 TaxID=3364323 RepID=UPI0037BBA7BC